MANKQRKVTVRCAWEKCDKQFEVDKYKIDNGQKNFFCPGNNRRCFIGYQRDKGLGIGRQAVFNRY